METTTFEVIAEVRRIRDIWIIGNAEKMEIDAMFLVHIPKLLHIIEAQDAKILELQAGRNVKPADSSPKLLAAGLGLSGNDKKDL